MLEHLAIIGSVSASVSSQQSLAFGQSVTEQIGPFFLVFFRAVGNQPMRYSLSTLLELHIILATVYHRRIGRVLNIRNQMLIRD